MIFTTSIIQRRRDSGGGNDFLLYNTITGALSYDADGNGGAPAVQFATLAGNPAITSADFAVF